MSCSPRRSHWRHARTRRAPWPAGSLRTASISDKPDLSADAAELIGAAAKAVYADFRCGFDVVFFAAFSFAGFLPEIASSISFCPAAAFLSFFVAFEGCSFPTLRRSASIRSTTLPAAGRSFGVIGLMERVLLLWLFVV